MCERSDTKLSRYSSAGITLNKLTRANDGHGGVVNGGRRRAETRTKADSPGVAFWYFPSIFECIWEGLAHVV